MKKILIILFLILLVMPVCFAEDNTTDVALTSDIDESDEYTHIYFNSSQVINGNGSQQNPYKDMSRIQPRIDTKTVFHFADGNYSYTYSSMGIYSDVKFIGESSKNTIITLNGNAFLITNGNNFTISNLTLYNTSIAEYDGNLNCEDVVFRQNEGFTKTTAGYYLGGVIYTNGNVVLNNTLFEDSSADYGGAIYLNSNANLIANNSSFINMSATSGGVIYSKVDVTIKKSRFIKNSAREGGVIYTTSKLDISESSFINNTATGGAVISIADSALLITDSNFTFNNALSYGGTISCTNSSNFTLKNSNFVNDTSKVSAGAIYTIKSKNYFYDSNFTNCSGLFGGAVCDLNSTSCFYNINFNSNSAYRGGAVYMAFNTTTISASNFTKNSAAEGGGLYIDNTTLVSLEKIIFNQNTANLGSGIYSIANQKINSNNVKYLYNLSSEIYQISKINMTSKEAANYTLFNITNTDVNIESKYDMRDYNLLSEVKNQELEGNCWAFAAMASLESCIIKANGSMYDFSEANMKNLMATYSDIGQYSPETNQGGNLLMAMGYFASWIGPVSESDDIYSSNVLSNVYNATTHIQNILTIKRSTYTDNDGIKEAILKYGAVATDMTYSSLFLNTQSNAYYCNNIYLSNHAVTIVGWDDNYSKDNFLITPSGDGAFIVRNSWGPSWGENGYFYVSYYDKSFARIGQVSSYTFILNDTNHYDKNYGWEYQPNTYLHYGFKTLYIKNVFTAESDELISAVSTYFYATSTWQADVYLNNTLKTSLSGTTSSGYYTFTLPQKIPIKKGDVFTVSFKITPIDRSVAYIYVFEYSDNYKLAQKGVSYYSFNGNSWWDLSQSTHNSAAAIKSFTNIGKLNTTLDVTGLDTDWQPNTNVNLQATVKDQYDNLLNDGEVIFSVDGQKYTVSVVNGCANKTVNFTTAGFHNISVIYNTDYYYSSSNATKIIYIDLTETILTVTISNSTLLVNDSLTVTASVDKTKGNVSFYINDVLNTTITVSSYGKAVLILNNLYSGEYNITAKYSDSTGVYLNASNKTSFSVGKKHITIDCEDIEMYYSQNNKLSITFRYDGNTVSNLEVSVNKSTTFTDENGKISYSLSAFNAGSYNFTVNIDNWMYEGFKTVNVLIKPASTDLKLILSNNPVYINQSVSVKAFVNASRGNVSFFINDKLNFTCDVNEAVLALSNLAFGEYKIKAVYSDLDNNYQTCANTTLLNVLRLDNTIEIHADDISYGQIACLDIIFKSPDGNANIKISGDNGYLKTYALENIENNHIVKELIDLNASKYHITVEYMQSGEYNSKTESKIFNVNRINPKLDVKIINATYGNAALIKISTDTTGNVSIKIESNKNYDELEIVDGNVTQEVNDIDAGEYNVSITYNGNENYNNITLNTLLKINKAPSEIFLKTDNITYGDVLKVNITASVDGSVDLAVGNVYKKIFTLKANNTTTILVDDLNAGSYNISLKLTPNSNYNESEYSTTFTVNIKDTSVNLNVINFTYGENVICKVTASENGVVTAKIGNITRTINVYKNMQTDVDFGILDSGLYSVDVNFSVNGNYKNSSNNGSFKVSKIIPLLLITTKNITYGEIAKITITSNLNYNATLQIQDKTYNIELNNGIKTFNITNIDSGNFTVSVTINGSKNYDNTINKTTINVYKAATSVKIDPISDIVYGSDLKVNFMTVNQTTLNYTLIKDGKIIACQIITSNITLAKFTPGQYSINITNLETDNYLKSSDFKTFTVKKQSPTITVSVNDTYSALITINSDAEGSVNVYIDNVKVGTSSINNGKAVFAVKNQSKGYHLINITYEGSELYLSGSASNYFNVNGVTPSISVKIADISVGDVARAVISLNSDAGGSIIVSAGDKTLNLTINSPQTIANFSSLASGKYIIEVVYSGDNKYASAKTNSTFNVRKLTPDISLQKTNNTLEVTLTSGATGNAVLTIGYSKYTETLINSKASFNLSSIASGTYSITVSYSGDNKYLEKSITDTVVINSIVITAGNVTKYYSSSDRFKVTLTDNNNPIANVSVKITINGLTYEKTTNNQGSVSIALGLSSGSYEVITEYNNIKAYSTVLIKNTVLGNNLVKIYRNSTQYRAIFLDSAGNLLKNTEIEFNINGILYKRTTKSNGVATMNINLNPNEYIITATNPSTGEKYTNTITVLSSIVDNNDIVKYYKNATKYTLRVLKSNGSPAGAGETVVLNINGILYEKKTNASGHINMNINLYPGTYLVTAQYNGLYATNTIKVLSILSANDLKMKYRDGTRFEVTLLNGKGDVFANQQITFNINGMIYTRTTNANGVAKLNINLIAGEYIITSTYNTLNMANKITITW